MRTTEDTATAIRERAYHIWEHAGRPEGRDEQHWFQAAQEHFSAVSDTKSTANAKKAAARKAGSAADGKATSPRKATARKRATPNRIASRRP
jgi:hypothetical protein